MDDFEDMCTLQSTGVKETYGACSERECCLLVLNLVSYTSMYSPKDYVVGFKLGYRWAKHIFCFLRFDQLCKLVVTNLSKK